MEEWLKFQQNLQAFITRQNITNAQGVNGPQIEPNYQQTMTNVQTHMFPLQAYVTQTWYIRQTLAKLHNMSLCAFVACINEMNDWLEQFLPRDNGTPQVKLAEDESMDILENAVPQSWQGEIRRQQFDCAAKGQAKFIRFCKNL
eukprot:15169745-Ditylum_brightwellii.AAC.1